MKQYSKNAFYHFLGATVGIIPLLGLAAPVLFFMFRKSPPLEEENQYRAVINFLLTYFLVTLGIFILMPKLVAFVVWIVWLIIAVAILIANGFLALKGKDISYPFAITFVKPLKRMLSPEELMYSDTNSKY
jgi:uncharacterized Tic20 family protein